MKLRDLSLIIKLGGELARRDQCLLRMWFIGCRLGVCFWLDFTNRDLRRPERFRVFQKMAIGNGEIYGGSGEFDILRGGFFRR